MVPVLCPNITFLRDKAKCASFVFWHYCLGFFLFHYGSLSFGISFIYKFSLSRRTAHSQLPLKLDRKYPQESLFWSQVSFGLCGKKKDINKTAPIEFGLCRLLCFTEWSLIIYMGNPSTHFFLLFCSWSHFLPPGQFIEFNLFGNFS